MLTSIAYAYKAFVFPLNMQIQFCLFVDNGIVIDTLIIVL